MKNKKLMIYTILASLLITLFIPINYIKATISNNSCKIIQLQLNNQTINNNGVYEKIDTYPYSKSGTTLVPLKFISDVFGAETKWDGKNDK